VRPHRRWLRPFVRVSGWAYLGFVIATVLALRFVGERFWLTGMALYVPRVVFLAPVVVLLVFGVALRLSTVLWTQLAAGLLVLFPLMGFVLPSPRASATGTQVRVFSLNVNSLVMGDQALADRIAHYDPDVILLQELGPNGHRIATRLRESYPALHVSGQFLLASRYPLLASNEPGRFELNARSRTERFMRYELDTPLGPVAFYNMHPLSPRWAFYAMRGMRVRTSLKNGTIMRGGAAEESMRENFEVRERQLAAVARRAAADTIPQVLSGDTNLPGLSPIVARHLSGYSDAFASAGWGFGYTFPSRTPWMRIDRVFVSRDLRVTSVQVGCDEDSDHRCVVASIERSAE
jgi:vancomycin resistance protein VanJ